MLTAHLIEFSTCSGEEWCWTVAAACHRHHEQESRHSGLGVRGAGCLCARPRLSPIAGPSFAECQWTTWRTVFRQISKGAVRALLSLMRKSPDSTLLQEEICSALRVLLLGDPTDSTASADTASDSTSPTADSATDAPREEKSQSGELAAEIKSSISNHSLRCTAYLLSYNATFFLGTQNALP